MRQHLIRARKLTHLLDSQFKVGPWRFGLDPLFGLLPGLGDLIPVILSLYLVWIGWQARLPISKILWMVFYILLDLAIGAIPILGDLLDFGFKASERNMRLLEQHLGIPLEADSH